MEVFILKIKRMNGEVAIGTILFVAFLVVLAAAVVGTLIWANSDADNSSAVPGDVCHSKCAWLMKSDCATGEPMGLCLGIWACDDPVSGVNECKVEGQ